MTIGSDRRCRRPKRSTSHRDEARSPHMDATRKKSNKNTEQNSVLQLSHGWRFGAVGTTPC